MKIERPCHRCRIGGQANDGFLALEGRDVIDCFSHGPKLGRNGTKGKKIAWPSQYRPNPALKIFTMGIRVLQIFAALFIMIGATAFAQDRMVPESEAQMTMSFAPIVKKISPAVVNIYTKKIVQERINPFMADPMFERFFGDMGARGLSREKVQNSLGSGVIVEPDGLIVTNAHVVKDAQEIMVVLSDRREFGAKVSLIDEPSDIAILHVDTKGELLPHAALEPSEHLQVGDIVLAIGNPFGVGQTVTSGIVSALARSTLNINDFNFFIQTDAAINPGNSGGPLVAMDGDVVGINSAIYSRSGGSLGIGFAIPSEMVATVIAAEKSGNKGRIQRAWVGINGQQVTADIADSLELSRPAGVLITSIHLASPLLKEGMQVGDVVTSVNDHKIDDTSELKFRLATVPLGQDIAISVLRKGTPMKFTVKATAAPDKPARETTALQGKNPLEGAKIANINPAVASEMNLHGEEEGVVVIEVANGHTAARLVQAGDILVSINNMPIKTVKDVTKALQVAKGGFALVVDRAGQKTQIVIR